MQRPMQRSSRQGPKVFLHEPKVRAGTFAPCKNLTPTAQVYTPEIRFVDIDAAGIVTMLPTSITSSRAELLSSASRQKWDWNAAGMVVARHEIDYRAPILFNDDVRIVTWIEHIGTKSMTAAYEVYKQWQGAGVGCPSEDRLVSYNHKEEGRRHGLKKWWKRRRVSRSGGLIFDSGSRRRVVENRQANASLTWYFIYFWLRVLFTLTTTL